MVTEPLSMSLFSKKEYLGRIYGRYQRAGREHKSKILDEFCAVCGYHRKFALRLLHRPLRSRRRRPGARRQYDPQKLLPVLKPIWLAAEQPCGKRLAAMQAARLGIEVSGADSADASTSHPSPPGSPPAPVQTTSPAVVSSSSMAGE